MKTSIPERIHDALTHYEDWHPVVTIETWLPDVNPASLGKALARLKHAGEVEVRLNGHGAEYRAVPKVKDETPWHEWVASALKVSVPCRFCGGSGQVTGKPSRHGMVRLLLGYTGRTSVSSWVKLSERFANPNLDMLERLAGMLGTDLDAAAKFSRELSIRMATQENR